MNDSGDVQLVFPIKFARLAIWKSKMATIFRFIRIYSNEVSEILLIWYTPLIQSSQFINLVEDIYMLYTWQNMYFLC